MRIKEILQQRGMTAKELAEIIGMTPTGLSLAMSEDGNPPLKRLKQIAEVLHVSVAELFTDEINANKMVAFFHYKGNSHLPTTVDQVMSILKDWEAEEFHKECHRRDFDHLREKYEDNHEILSVMETLCTLIGCTHDTHYNKDTQTDL